MLKAARALALALTLIVAVAPRLGHAIDELAFQVHAITGEGWSSGPLDVRMQLLADGRVALRARARELSLPGPLATFKGATFQCRDGRWDGDGIRCDDTQVSFTTGSEEPVRLRVALELDPDSGRFALRMKDQPVAGGRLGLTLESSGSRARIRARFSGLALPLVAGGVALVTGALPVEVTAGSVSGSVQAEQTAGRSSAEATLTFDDVGYSGPEGLRVGESLVAEVRLSGKGVGDEFDVTVDARIDAGLAYEDPLLLEFAGDPVTLRVEARVTADEVVTIRSFAMDDPAGARVTGSADLSLAAAPLLQGLDVRVERVPVARLYKRYLKSYAGVGVVSDLDIQGQASGRLQWRDGRPVAATLELNAVDVGDRGGRFALFGLSGNLVWGSTAPGTVSNLDWTSAQVYAVDLGAGAARGVLVGDGLRLSEPLAVPVLDGGIRIERLDARSLGSADATVEVDLEVEPLSLKRLSDRLAWLPLAGSVSGRFPRLTYTDRRVAVNGDVQIRLFDGDVTVSSLTLDDPLGVVPRLRADVKARGIDLEVLTRAFSFGSIEGRLDGDIQGLVLEAWQPLSFDAVIATPAGDSSRRRISQRAVDNLASLGGANAVLSSTFLRIFQEFSYDRLGLSCRLRAGVCEMGGVAPATNGYYIVKGGGIPPRVDVVGFNSRVDWSTLVERLKSVASSQGPVIR